MKQLPIRIVQCWDDGVIDDTRLTELLRTHRAKASFNLNPGFHGVTRSQPWRYKESKEVSRLARDELTSVYDGFTIANQTVTHPWPLKIPLAKWRNEVCDGRSQLQDIFQQPVSGFAHPFGQYDKATAYVLREAGHTYARTCENATPCHAAADSLCHPTDSHFKAPDFWQRYETAKAVGATVFYFWGHSYECITEADWGAFEQKLIQFNTDPDAQWAELPEVFQ